jgi:aspartyl-tRNA(Asn)/glutamyl-tRNA(Gln) amidotransferase subunit C
MNIEDVKKLAIMARIDMSDDEIQGIVKDFDGILAYVGQVQEVSKLNNVQPLHENPDNYFLKNVMREDIITNISGEYSEKILEDAPDIQDGFFKVKKIL